MNILGMIKRQTFGMRGIIKNIFQKCWKSHCIIVDFAAVFFDCFLYILLGLILISVDAVETGFKFGDFP